MYKKFIWLMAIIFMTANFSGCGAGVIKSASKTVSTQSKKIAKEGAVDMAVDVANSAILDDSPGKNNSTAAGKTSTVKKGAAALAGGAAVTAAGVAAAEVVGNRHWIQDANTGVYLWNPEPTDGETVYWSGGYVQDGDKKFAEGSGTVTWQRYGKTVQVDEGGFSHGRHHGQFKHTFIKSGRVEYSDWDNGVEIR